MKLIYSFLFWLSISAAFANDINLEADSVHAPFYYGVASGDPLTDKVIIWTHITSTQVLETVTYQVALDSTFNNIVSSGTLLLMIL